MTEMSEGGNTFNGILNDKKQSLKDFFHGIKCNWEVFLYLIQSKKTKQSGMKQLHGKAKRVKALRF